MKQDKNDALAVDYSLRLMDIDVLVVKQNFEQSHETACLDSKNQSPIGTFYIIFVFNNLDI